jgi:hypothetical protein
VSHFGTLLTFSKDDKNLLISGPDDNSVFGSRYGAVWVYQCVDNDTLPTALPTTTKIITTGALESTTVKTLETTTAASNNEALGLGLGLGLGIPIVAGAVVAILLLSKRYATKHSFELVN